MGDTLNTKRMAVDCHAHVFLKNLPLATHHRHAPEFDAPLSQYMRLLDAHNITHAVLVQPSFLGTDNSFMLSALREHPQRLRCVVMLDPTTGEDELSALDVQGVVGVRLNLVGLPLPDISTPVWQTFFARLRALDWHLELHRESIDIPTLVNAAMPSGCRIVVDHFGRPSADLAHKDPGFATLLKYADSGRVWVKLAAAYRNSRTARMAQAQHNAELETQDQANANRCAADLLAAYGAQRLVWGSDWPHTQHQHLIDYSQSLAVLSEWVPNASQRAQILGSTAAKLFKLPS